MSRVPEWQEAEAEAEAARAEERHVARDRVVRSFAVWAFITFICSCGVILIWLAWTELVTFVGWP